MAEGGDGGRGGRPPACRCVLLGGLHVDEAQGGGLLSLEAKVLQHVVVVGADVHHHEQHLSAGSRCWPPRFPTTLPARPIPASTCPRNGGAASPKPASSSWCEASVWLTNSSRWLGILAAKILGDVCGGKAPVWGAGSLDVPRTPANAPAAPLTWLLNSVTRCMLCVRRKSDRSPWSRPSSSSTGKSARPSSNWTTLGGSVGATARAPTPTLASTHLLEEHHGVLGEAKLLKELRLVSEAKGHV